MEITKTCLITGANAGIGKESAIAIGKQGYRILMVCRNRQKAEKAKKEIIDKIGHEEVKLYLCDLSSQKQIRELAEKIKANHHQLDVLLNNAGFFASEYNKTEDGIETTWAVNHLAYFMLTLLLLDLLKNTPASRIVNVASGAHHYGKIDFNNLEMKGSFDGFKQYCNSKLANILFTHELAKRLTVSGADTTVNCLHPGVVASNFQQNLSGWFKWAMILAKPFMISSAEGAKTQVYLATSLSVKNITGKYFERKQIRRPNKLAFDDAVSKKLWDVSLKATGLEQVV